MTKDEVIRCAKEANALRTVSDIETGEVNNVVEAILRPNTKENFKPLKHTDFNIEFNDTIRYLLHLVFFEKKLKQIDISVLLYISTKVNQENEMTYIQKSFLEELNVSKPTISDSIDRLQAYKFIDIIENKHNKKIRLLTLNCHLTYRGDKYSVQSSLSDSPHIVGFKDWAKENNCNLRSVVYKYGTTENTQININVNIAENIIIQQTEKKQ
jgi:hypothetical protein